VSGWLRIFGRLRVVTHEWLQVGGPGAQLCGQSRSTRWRLPLRRYLSQPLPRLLFPEGGTTAGRGAEMTYRLSDHARVRCYERQVPESVLECIQGGSFVAQALEDDGRISNFHIVRVATLRYWVGVERDGVMVTILPVGFEGSAARDWFSRRLLNFRHVISTIEALPVTSTRKLRRLHEAQLAVLPGSDYPTRRDRTRPRDLGVAEGRGALGEAWGLTA
jgi:hypothetical protein